jgi:hypothetical protein
VSSERERASSNPPCAPFPQRGRSPPPGPSSARNRLGTGGNHPDAHPLAMGGHSPGLRLGNRPSSLAPGSLLGQHDVALQRGCNRGSAGKLWSPFTYGGTGTLRAPSRRTPSLALRCDGVGDGRSAGSIAGPSSARNHSATTVKISQRGPRSGGPVARLGSRERRHPGRGGVECPGPVRWAGSCTPLPADHAR